MIKIKLKLTGLFCLLFFTAGIFAQQEYNLELNAKKIGGDISPTMYGLFFEDINFGADGGLYAELVKNRSFDFPQNLMGWNIFGKVKVSTQDAPFDKNPTYLIFSDPGHAHKRTGIENEGFKGIGFKKDSTYRFSVWAKNMGKGDQKIKVEFINSKSDIIGNADVVITSASWKKYEVIVTAKKNEEHGRLRIFLASKGDIALDHVSLFPTNTYKGRENGLRKDLAQALTDINPGVFRFPGGCIVEGTDLKTRYNWKNTVGPVENRPVNENRWHYTFQDRYFPDYYQSNGLGFYEYFLLSEDMGASPLPILNCGLSCQYQNSSEDCHVPLSELDPYIQDALDLIEFANGAMTSKWGKVRADMGHPAPFNLKYIGIGNEQWGKEYVDRLALFVKAIRAKYPEIEIIGSSGPLSDGKDFDYLWPEMKRLKVDIVDEHYYKDPQWFLDNARRYDQYDRKGPGVFAGEYACHDYSKGKQNNFKSALYEAAFMTGLERNADIVKMCTYAPLLAHVDAWQWRPDMIWFDNMRMMKTPNYYVQQIYGHNKGTNIVPLTCNKDVVAGQDGLYSSAVYDKDEKCYIIKVVNTADETKNITIDLKGIKGDVKVDGILMQQEDLNVVNTLDQPKNIVPKKIDEFTTSNKLQLQAKPYSFATYKVYTK